MPCRMGMLRRVAVRRAVAAPRTAARLTSAQVNPDRSSFHALVTLRHGRKFDVTNFIDVCATLIAHDDNVLVEIRPRKRSSWCDTLARADPRLSCIKS